MVEDEGSENEYKWVRKIDGNEIKEIIGEVKEKKI